MEYTGEIPTNIKSRRSDINHSVKFEGQRTKLKLASGFLFTRRRQKEVISGMPCQFVFYSFFVCFLLYIALHMVRFV